MLRFASFIRYPALLAGALLCAQAAQAQSVIGQATQAAPEVIGALGARRVTIASGSAVHQNETIQTSAEGSTVLRFRDSTNLAVGAGASVRLDRYVYNADSSVRQAVVNMTQGAFRWTTGASDPSAFRLQTPHAVIGIRGTVLDVDVDRTRTRIALREGAINVCPRRAPRNCADLRPGQSIIVLADGSLLEPDALRRPEPARPRIEFQMPVFGGFGGFGGGPGGGGRPSGGPSRLR
jgi:hypothetical protein